MILANKNRDNFVLVDGSSYLYRAFYALPNLTTVSGFSTGAIHGVINMINKLIKTYEPKYLSVIFDPKGKTFRHDIYKEYKANRKPMPIELSEQVPPLINFIKALGISVLQVPDVEADDVIATLATKLSSKKNQVIISSGDKDLAQLVTQYTVLINSMDDKVLDEAGVKEKFGVLPNQILDYLMLVGDSSDNIPGVQKVGPKKAAELLLKYKSIDGIFTKIEEITGKLKENLSNYKNFIETSKKLIQLKVDVDVDTEINKYKISNRNEQKLAEIASRYELKNIASSLSIDMEPRESQETSYTIVSNEKDFNQLIDKLNKVKIFSFDTETTSLDYIDAELVGMSFSTESHSGFYIPINHKNEDCNIKLNSSIRKKLKDLLENKKNTIIGQNIKYDINVLRKYNINISSNIEDTMVLSYVFNSSGRHDLSTLSQKYLNHRMIEYEDVVGKGVKQKNFSEIDIETASEYACEDADITYRLFSFFNQKMSDEKQLKLYQKIERPLVSVIARIENNGVFLDKKNLQLQNKKLQTKAKKIEKEIYKLAGKTFNIGSPKQLQEIFYDILEIPILRKTPKGQPSTSEDVLQELSLNYEIPKLVLQFRNFMKLINTYTNKLGEQVSNKTGRLHTSYHQAVTITGRLSSTDPNLQNIPIRTDDGKKIRSAFVAEKNCKIVSADYSQIELRVMAHLSEDKNLTKNFLNNEDVHESTAKEIFDIDSKPDAEQRRSAKTINFGLIYGISSFGLGKQLGIDTNSAKQYIEKYFEKYSGVRKFMESCKKETKKEGCISTILGRKIFIPNINHTNFQIRSAAERTAINAPIQGTAADIIKIAMIDIDKWIQESKCPVKIIMQVHDELVFEIADDFVEEAVKKIDAMMSNCLKLNVPLLVEIGVDKNWGDAH
tara:strand:+ start:1590 stop:4274 length:2685 start_codon:yes stop_codon:yes gene_type:complete